MDIVSRVAARFCFRRALEVGRGVFTEENLKIHRYRDHLRITDMTFAGKRGKTVKSLVVNPQYLQDALANKVLDQAVKAIEGKNYAQAKAKLEELADKYPGLLKLEEATARGVDVEPMGTPIDLEKKFPDGTIISINSTPHEFLVKNSVVMRAPGKPADGFRQDTLYSNVKKQDGVIFYAWAKDNVSKLANMTMDDLRKTWDSLGVQYDYH
jgi:hypothetical protein